VRNAAGMNAILLSHLERLGRITFGFDPGPGPI
jgi:hypothetical protein